MCYLFITPHVYEFQFCILPKQKRLFNVEFNELIYKFVKIYSGILIFSVYFNKLPKINQYSLKTRQMPSIIYDHQIRLFFTLHVY